MEIANIEDMFDIMEAPSRQDVAALEEAMKDMPQADCPVAHFFAKGAYMRCVHLPAGTHLTSKTHQTQHISVIISGDVTVFMPDGETGRYQGPYVFITEPNTKRAIVVHEDTVWVTFHVTNKTDLSEIEREIMSEDYIDEVEL